MSKEFVYKIQTKEFEGWVKLDLMKHKERLALSRACQFAIEQKGGDASFDFLNDNLMAMERLMEHTEKRVKGLEIKHIESETIAKSWSDTEYESDWNEVRQEIGFVVLRGVPLGGLSGKV